MPDETPTNTTTTPEATPTPPTPTTPTHDKAPTPEPTPPAPPAPPVPPTTTTPEPTKKEPPKPPQKAPSLLEPPADEKPIDPLDTKISEWSSFRPSIPEGFEINPDALESFGATAVEAGLTQRQANALIGWQLKEIQARQQAMYEVGKEALQKEWGPKFADNQKAVIGLISRIDRALGDNSFSKSINDSGAGLHPGVIRGLYKLSTLISEDSLGKDAGGSAPPPETEDFLQGIKNALREQIEGTKK